MKADAAAAPAYGEDDEEEDDQEEDDEKDQDDEEDDAEEESMEMTAAKGEKAPAKAKLFL